MIHRISGKAFLLLAGALLFSITLEFLLVFDFWDFCGSCHIQVPERSYDIRSLTFTDCAGTEDGTVTCDDGTPGILVRDVHDYVSAVDVCLKRLPYSVVRGTLFWSKEDKPDSFSKKRSKPIFFKENQGAASVEINKRVASIRIVLELGRGDVFQLQSITVNPHAMTYLKHVLPRMSFVRVILYFLLTLAVLAVMSDWAGVLKFVFRYRWWIGFAVIGGCTVLKLHGSSIGLVSEWLTGADPSRLWLSGRQIRSDEYIAFTQMALSQAKSGFHWFSDTWGYSPSDMFIVYGQPVWNLVTLYRPFSAGYLLLGAEYGLSFYWISRLVFCFLVSFEFGRILTREKKVFAAAYAFMVAFSPVVQWWFSTNEFVEILIFGQGAVVLFHRFIRVEGTSRIRRLACKGSIVFGLVICSGGYILSFYPAWMIPFFYAFLACGIAYIIDNRSVIRLKREDLLLLLAGIAVLACSMGYILHESGGTIHAILNTAYPGKREYPGGPADNAMFLFQGWTGSIWSFIDTANPCEMADFVSMFPIGLFLSGVVLFREKKRDAWLILLNITGLFLAVYMIFGMPGLVGKLTMLRLSSYRILNAVGFINLMVLFRAASLSKGSYGRRLVWAANGLAVLAIVFSLQYGSDFMSSGVRGIVMIGGLVLTNLLLLALAYRKPFHMAFLAAAMAVSIIGGAYVNPISSGLDGLYHSNVLRAVDAVNKEAPGTWAVCGPLTYSNLPALVGAKTVTALATYPDHKLWEDLGLTDEKSEKAWNRYAHMEMTLGEETRVESPQPDLVSLTVTIDDLRKLGVRYLLSTEELEDGSLSLLYDRSGLRIYRMEDISA